MQTHIEAAHTKRLYIENTESICLNKFIEEPQNIILSLFIQDRALYIIYTLSIKTEWIDVSV